MSEYKKYTPENHTEELFELVGRVKAFSAYVNSTKYSIERVISALMFVYELEDESKDAR